jgi:type II secretory pathway pseudopilin PulG
MKVLVVLGILAAILTVTLSSTSRAARSTTATLTAVVNVDGSLARGRGAVSSSQLGVDGQYEVVFNRDVSNCAYVASGGEATTFPPDDAVVFTVAPRDGNANAVFVQEWDGVLGYDFYSSGFHLVVVC